MTTRIGLISDTHSSTGPLAEALQIFKTEQVDKIICAGDVAGYGDDELIQTIRLLKDNNCLVISGNHDELPDEHSDLTHSDEIKQYIDALPKFISLELEDKSIYVVHAAPPDLQHGGIKLLDQDGSLIEAQKRFWETELKDFDYDVLITGHTHQVFAEHIGSTLVINPGSTIYNHSCMILSLPEMTVTTYPLQNREIVKSWNWSVFYRENR